MSELKIDDIDRLKWLLLVAGCAVVVLYGLTRKRQALRAFVSPAMLGTLVPNVSFGRQYIRSILVLLAMVCIVLAAMGPRWGRRWEEVQQRQLDLVICLDVSRSMLAEDAGMSRLDRAKDDIKRLLQRLDGGQIGLVAFAGRPELVCPLTDDYEYYRLVLEDVGIHSAPKGGTDFGQAIVAASKAFGDLTLDKRAIVLITDGEDHGRRGVEETVKVCDADQHLSIYTVGVGDEERGGLIPIERNGQRTYLVHEGQQLWSKMNPAELKAIARAGCGKYYPSRQVTATQRTLDRIYMENLAPAQELSTGEQRVQRHIARFHWPAGLALVLLMLETLISEGRSAKNGTAKNGMVKNGGKREDGS